MGYREELHASGRSGEESGRARGQAKNSSTGGTVGTVGGAVLGGALGSIGGPAGIALGASIGASLGGASGGLIGGLWSTDKESEKARKKAILASKRRMDQRWKSKKAEASAAESSGRALQARGDRAAIQKSMARGGVSDTQALVSAMGTQTTAGAGQFNAWERSRFG